MSKKVNKLGLTINSKKLLTANEIIQLIGKDSPKKKEV
jgi:hypothetical protein